MPKYRTRVVYRENENMRQSGGTTYPPFGGYVAGLVVMAKRHAMRARRKPGKYLARGVRGENFDTRWERHCAFE